MSLTPYPLRPVTRDEARAAVTAWHSHHRPHIQQRLAIGYELEPGRIAAVVVLEDPKACALRNGRTWEVTRLCVGPDAPHCVASKLLGAACRATDGAPATAGIPQFGPGPYAHCTHCRPSDLRESVLCLRCRQLSPLTVTEIAGSEAHGVESHASLDQLLVVPVAAGGSPIEAPVAQPCRAPASLEVPGSNPGGGFGQSCKRPVAQQRRGR